MTAFAAIAKDTTPGFAGDRWAPPRPGNRQAQHAHNRWGNTKKFRTTNLCYTRFVSRCFILMRQISLTSFAIPSKNFSEPFLIQLTYVR
jgi:hypothetical protein